MTAQQVALSARGLVKEFNGFIAVDAVDLDVRRGSIHALIGPNGAGKTTLFNLLTKFLIPTRGSISYEGEDITQASPSDIARKGMIRSFQISSVFGHMTALENVRVALQRGAGGTFRFWKPRTVLQALDARAIELLQEVDLAGEAQTFASELPYGRKRALEIATTLATDPRMLLLDEPTAGMSHDDVQRVKELIRRVAANRTVLMVEHNMSVVADLCDRITVLQWGRVLAEGPYAEVSKDERVIEAYIGGPEQ